MVSKELTGGGGGKTGYQMNFSQTSMPILPLVKVSVAGLVGFHFYEDRSVQPTGKVKK
jgi:hypothetical protein